jgi:hypothetical protein
VWADFVQFGDASEIAALVEHNRVDLLSLAALVPALSRIYLEPETAPATAPAAAAASLDEPATARGPQTDAAAIARMQVRRKRPGCARAHLSASEADLDARALLELASLHRLQRDWPAALRLWRVLAGEGCAEAIESLAKYHEHVSRDFTQALGYCELLCRAAPASVEHQRRLRRLTARAGQPAPRDLFAATSSGPEKKRPEASPV